MKPNGLEAEVLRQIKRMLEGDNPTAGVYSMYVSMPMIEESR